MPIMIPIDVQAMPAVPTIDMNEFCSRVSVFATSLYDDMVQHAARSIRGHRTMKSDDELEQELSKLPAYVASISDMDTITKEDYHRYAQSHHTMKGIAKWL